MDEIELNSRGYILINNALGIEISAENADVRVPVASLTKMMTAVVVLEKCDLSEVVVITEEMLAGLEGFAKVGLRVGQTATVEDLLYATMLPSAGDAAQALAIKIGGLIAGFVELMNRKVVEMGLTDTHFSNPVGMDEDNYSTPREVVRILQEAVGMPEFVKVFESFEKELPSLGITVKKTFEKIPYIKGGKTGFTNDAGRCLASTAEVEGVEYILVTVGAETGKNIEDAEMVYRKVEEEYEPVEVIREGEWIIKMPVRGSATEEVEFLAERNVIVALEKEATEGDLSYEYIGQEEITRDTLEGEELGRLVVKYGEQELYTQEIRYEGGVEFYDYGWVGSGLGMGLVGLAIGALGYWKLRKKAKRSRWRILRAMIATGGLITLVVSGMVFSGWFVEEGNFVVNRPEWRIVEEWK